MKNFRKISVIGLGLIASSICLAIRQKNPKITCPFMCADHCRTDRNSVKEFYDLYGYELGESKVANATYEIFWLTHT